MTESQQNPDEPNDPPYSTDPPLAQHALHMRNKAIVLTPEVHGLGRNHDPHPVRREDHAEAFNAETISDLPPATGTVSMLVH